MFCMSLIDTGPGFGDAVPITIEDPGGMEFSYQKAFSFDSREFLRFRHSRFESVLASERASLRACVASLNFSRPTCQVWIVAKILFKRFLGWQDRKYCSIGRPADQKSARSAPQKPARRRLAASLTYFRIALLVSICAAASSISGLAIFLLEKPCQHRLFTDCRGGLLGKL